MVKRICAGSARGGVSVLCSCENDGRADAIALSLRARVLWAKTGGGEQRDQWSPLYVHMGDSACIGRLLWNEWLPASVKRQIADSLGCDDEAAAALVALLVGIHDIGKATPGFQYKVPELAERVEESGLVIPSPYMMNHPPSHAYMGEVVLEKWLERRGWVYPEYLGSVVGAHHGTTATSNGLNGIMLSSVNFPNENMGDDGWGTVQDELLEWIFAETEMNEYEGLIQSVKVPRPQLILLSAIVIMCDWIASNSDLFPLVDRIHSWGEFEERAQIAWSSLSLPPAWRAVCSEMNEQELFRGRFDGLPENANLRPAQLEALHAAFAMDGSGLLIVEAPMGSGKTEASLLCAEVLAAKTGAGGVAYLLPTMATSNAMFQRVESWLERTPDSRGRSAQSMRLLHGKAALNADYAKMSHWGSTWMGDNDKSGYKEDGLREDVIAHQWFGGSKRGLLSSFVVGTVDQLLMAALKTKHVQLRHLGLAGKVVIIDEVHAYDAYMNMYLDRVLTWLGAYGVPTILLSATLPAARRSELVHAYRGMDNKSSRRPSKRKDIPAAPREDADHPAYPLITTAGHGGLLDERMYRTCANAQSGTDVTVQELEDDDATLVATLGDLLDDGGCACVLRDTVERAQRTYSTLKEAFGDQCVKLVHSRFVAVDRMANDTELLKLLGPDSGKRPEKLIVVGTQVMEQSLDIDFDVMITDIAPIDLLLQRMGRLHRHQRGEGQSDRPEKLREARCFITGVEDWGQVPPKIARGVDAIYQRALLWKSLLALRVGYNGQGSMLISLPRDIARLVEVVYAQNNDCAELCIAASAAEWSDELLLAEDDLLNARDKAQGRAKAWLLGKPPKREKSLVGWMEKPFSLTDETKARAAVRDTDESIEVVAVQRGMAGNYELLPWVVDSEGNRPSSSSLGDGASTPDDVVARLAANCTVTLPSQLSTAWNFALVIDALESQASVPGWQESRWLRGQLPLVVDAGGGASIETDAYLYRLRYSQEKGLELIESKRKERVPNESKRQF